MTSKIIHVCLICGELCKRLHFDALTKTEGSLSCL